MTTARWRRIEELFQSALALPPEERDAFLRQSCGDAPDILNEVSSLLTSMDSAGVFLETPAVGDGLEILQGLSSQRLTGQMVGPYRIMQELAHGGMGTVYLAERADDQFQKKVAIKLIRTEATDAYMLRRFRVERQILAGLEHPNIARLLDAGTTPSGAPFAVMEYVEGVPIDQYCEDNELSLNQRLRLFLEVCRAVQYAHAHLVVHRDIKPKNILVDSAGTPRLLDFGIAKLLAEDVQPGPGEASGATVSLMTPDYASPEQIKGEPVSTSSDVYALGLLLYRLLTGRHAHHCETSNPADMARVICDVEPEKPSRVMARSETGRKEDAGAASGARSRKLRRLQRQLAGDLDNIVLRALRKEPNQRYASVEQFAADIGRYLDGLPVLARAGGMRYQAFKMIKRHRVGVISLALILLALLGGVIATSIQARIAARERDRARTEALKGQQITSFLQQMIASVDPRADGRNVTVVQALDAAAARLDKDLSGQPEIAAAIRNTLGLSYLSLGLYDSAEPHLRRALDTRLKVLGHTHPDTAESYKNLSLLLSARGEFEKAEPLCRQALDTIRAAGGKDSLEEASILNALAELSVRKGDLAAAEKMHRQSLDTRRRKLGEQHPDVAESLNDLAVVLGTRGAYAEAARLHEEALRILLTLHGREHLDVAVTLSNLAATRESLKDYAAAERLFREALDMRIRILGADHPDVAWTLYNFAFAMYGKGDYKQSAALASEVLKRRGHSLPEEHPLVPGSLQVLGRSLDASGHHAEALPLLKESLTLRQKRLPPNHWLLANSESVLAECLLNLKRYSEAEPMLLRSHDALLASLGPAHDRTREASQRLVRLYEALGKPDKAAAFR